MKRLDLGDVVHASCPNCGYRTEVVGKLTRNDGLIDVVLDCLYDDADEAKPPVDGLVFEKAKSLTAIPQSPCSRRWIRGMLPRA